MTTENYKTSTPVKRPVWANHEIIGYITISYEDAEFLNGIDNSAFYLDLTEDEHYILNNGKAEDLIKAGFIKED